MTPLAIVFMGVSVTFVVGLTAWCFWKGLTAPQAPE